MPVGRRLLLTRGQARPRGGAVGELRGPWPWVNAGAAASCTEVCNVHLTELELCLLGFPLLWIQLGSGHRNI